MAGKIGLYFQFKLLFIKYKKQIVGTGFSKSKYYQDWAKFPAGRPNLMEFAGMPESLSASLVSFTLKKGSAEWTDNIDPYIPPVLSDNGSSMGLVYSDTLNDLSSLNPGVSKNIAGKWDKPETYTSWRTAGKSETIDSLDYGKSDDLEVMAFDSVDYDNTMAADGTVDSTEFNKSANSSEIHVYVNGKHTKLTSNSYSDSAPSVSASGNKAIVVWQRDTYALNSVTEDSIQSNLQGGKKICYCYYDGTSWSGTKYLEEGDIMGAQAYDVALSGTGTAMVVASMGTSEKVQERELYSYIIKGGEQQSVTRVTCNEKGETQPRVKYVTNGDGMFLTGWEESEYTDGAVTDNRVIFQGFSLDGSANDVSIQDDGQIAENYDFAKGGKTISDSAVYWQSTGEDGLTHTYAKYLNSSNMTTSQKYEMDSAASTKEAIIGSSVAVDGTKFTTVSLAQPQEDASTVEEEDSLLGAPTPDTGEEEPARLITGTKTIENTLSNMTANAFGQTIEPNSNIKVTVGFTNAGRKALHNITVKQNGKTLAENIPVEVAGSQYGQVDFNYVLGDTIQDESFEIIGDNGAAATAKLNLSGVDLTLENEEIAGVQSGGARTLQVVMGNAGTAPLKDTDEIRVESSTMREKGIVVTPVTESAKWDSTLKQIVISGKEAMDAINRGEYILQLQYTPKFEKDVDTASLSLNAITYNGNREVQELNALDNSASYSITKPSKVYDTQFAYSTVVENGTITQLTVQNQYEKNVEKTIEVSNGEQSQKVNVSLGSEEMKTYALAVPATSEITYREMDSEGEESPVKTAVPVVTEAPTPAPTVKPTITPTKEPLPTPGKTPEPSKVPEPAPQNTPQPPQPGTSTAAGLKVGTTFKSGSLVYKVTAVNTAGGTVSITKPASTKVKSITVPATVKKDGVVCKVTEVGKKAFAKCSKLKTITIRSKVIKKVGSKAFSGIHSKATIKVPKKSLAAYKKLFKGKGQKASVKIKGV